MEITMNQQLYEKEILEYNQQIDILNKRFQKHTLELLEFFQDTIDDPETHSQLSDDIKKALRKYHGKDS